VLETHGCHNDNFFEVRAVYEGIRHRYKQVGWWELPICFKLWWINGLSFPSKIHARKPVSTTGLKEKTEYEYIYKLFRLEAGKLGISGK
jgi:hypothetical protein